jgi:hypothetical protein
VTTGPTAVRPAGQTRGTAGTPREEGEDFKGPWGARRLGRRGARTPRRPGATRRGPARRGAVRRDAASKRVDAATFDRVSHKIFE